MSQPNKNLPRLIVEYGPEAGRVVELAASRFIIGRAESSDWRIDDPKISRQHAEIIREAERCFLADLGSRNGTFLNGQRLGRERQALTNGDEIQLGTLLTLRFEDPATTAVDIAAPIRSRGLWLDSSQREVYVRYQKLEPALSDKLFRLLELLAQSTGQVIPKDQIAHRIWPEVRGEVTDQMIDALVTRLRRRLAEADDQHEYVVRVRGQGLKFVQRT